MDTVIVDEFQLHHTGIKTKSRQQKILFDAQFQLHHTGIKTHCNGVFIPVGSLFQLHHTGIKTADPAMQAIDPINFNCTIQELKQMLQGVGGTSNNNFNCTIQELKPI